MLFQVLRRYTLITDRLDQYQPGLTDLESCQFYMSLWKRLCFADRVSKQQPIALNRQIEILYEEINMMNSPDHKTSPSIGKPLNFDHNERPVRSVSTCIHLGQLPES